MKKCLLLFLSFLFFSSLVHSQTITGTPVACPGGTTILYGSPAGLNWTTSAPGVAIVTSGGIVSGMSAGTAVITYGNIVAFTTVVVTVNTPASPIIGAASICASGGTTTLTSGPAGGTWYSSTPSVAAVGTSGVVTGLVVGTSTISYMPPSGMCPSTTVCAVTTCCTGVPTAGVVVPNLTSGCSLTPLSLNDTGASPGSNFQWQKSTDSVTWTSISGATSSLYSFTGLAMTTYYRCWVICPVTSLSSFTAGVKINSIICCGGGLTPGTVTASTGYCSACSLTLNLSGATVAPDVTYQWQYASSATGPWTNLAGATDTSHTFSPFGAFYYRCAVTCLSGSSFVAGSPVFVGYRYEIIADSVTPPNTACLSSFNAMANGVSPLLYMKTQYGDGTKDSTMLTASGVTSTSTTLHGYAYSGTYFIKKTLYYNNVPQDSLTFFNAYHCKTFPIKFYFDSDGDCVKDASETWNFTPVTVRVDSNSVPVDTLSATGGLYYRPLGATGTIYSFRVLSSQIAAHCPTSGVIYDTVQGSAAIYPSKSFGLSCGSTDIDLAVNTVSTTRSNQQWGTIYVRNNYCNVANAEVKFSYSPKYNLGPSPYITPASSIYGHTIVWNIPAISSLFYPPQRSFYFAVHSSPFLLPTDTVNQMCSVTTTSGTEVTIDNNIVIRNDTVRVSHDPNFVEVSPAGCFDSETLHLQYTVHFENMGNDTAHNIYVLDTLSEYLDEKSLEVVMSSHAMDVGVYHDGPFSVAKFDFPNIKLLDSSHHGFCDGAVIYTINAKPGIPMGGSIKARAGIYFDINEVVMTNTSEKVKGCPVSEGVAEQARVKPTLYPNPVNDELVVKAEVGVFSSFTITNSIGQEMIQQRIKGAQTRVNVKALPAGVYYVMFAGEGGKEVVKFVKE